MYSVYIAALIVSTHFLPSRTKPGKLLHLWTTRYEEALPISLNPEREIVHSSLYTVRGAFVCFSVSFRFPLPLAPALYSLFFFFFFSLSLPLCLHLFLCPFVSPTLDPFIPLSLSLSPLSPKHLQRKSRKTPTYSPPKDNLHSPFHKSTKDKKKEGIKE